ncbi:MAG: hypothetical protein GX814_09705 [Microbacteriaceae bacterium]|nr:hypothetical protein [Microbacteriaceae bacterium]
MNAPAHWIISKHGIEPCKSIAWNNHGEPGGPHHGRPHFTHQQASELWDYYSSKISYADSRIDAYKEATSTQHQVFSNGTIALQQGDTTEDWLAEIVHLFSAHEYKHGVLPKSFKMEFPITLRTPHSGHTLSLRLRVTPYYHAMLGEVSHRYVLENHTRHATQRELWSFDLDLRDTIRLAAEQEAASRRIIDFDEVEYSVRLAKDLQREPAPVLARLERKAKLRHNEFAVLKQSLLREFRVAESAEVLGAEVLTHTSLSQAIAHSNDRNFSETPFMPAHWELPQLIEQLSEDIARLITICENYSLGLLKAANAGLGHFARDIKNNYFFEVAPAELPGAGGLLQRSSFAAHGYQFLFWTDRTPDLVRWELAINTDGAIGPPHRIRHIAPGSAQPLVVDAASETALEAIPLLRQAWESRYGVEEEWSPHMRSDFSELRRLAAAYDTLRPRRSSPQPKQVTESDAWQCMKFHLADHGPARCRWSNLPRPVIEGRESERWSCPVAPPEQHFLSYAEALTAFQDPVFNAAAAAAAAATEHRPNRSNIRDVMSELRSDARHLAPLDLFRRVYAECYERKVELPADLHDAFEQVWRAGVSASGIGSRTFCERQLTDLRYQLQAAEAGGAPDQTLAHLRWAIQRYRFALRTRGRSLECNIAEALRLTGRVAELTREPADERVS